MPVGNPSLSGRRPFYITRNNRRVLWCEVTLGGQPLLLGSVHNDSFNLKNNTVQAQQELTFAGTRPTMLAGDFNARPTEPAIKLLRSSGRFTAAYDGPLTFPTDKPDQTIDFIFAPADWTLVEHHVPQCAASDHLPIVSTFRRVGPK
ncbi:MAG: endonuclease/exonuclease/phosphatase family protein [Planctomycetia bacterium]|nr:endonuclease/exonuclease/phosphatase family protein [Planctomycetia bacterium]